MAHKDAPDIEAIYADTGIDLSALPPISTTEELADVLRTSAASLSQDRYRGTGVPYVKHGRRVRYLKADVARYLADNRRHGTAVTA